MSTVPATTVHSRRRAVRDADWELPAPWQVVDLAFPPDDAAASDTELTHAVLLSALTGSDPDDPVVLASRAREDAVLPLLESALVLRCPPLVDDLVVYADGLLRHGGAYHAFGEDPLPWLAAADLAAAARTGVALLQDGPEPVGVHDVPAAGVAEVELLLRAAVPASDAPVVPVPAPELRDQLAGILGDPTAADAVVAHHSWAATLPPTAEPALLQRLIGRTPAEPARTLAGLLGAPLPASPAPTPKEDRS